MLEVVCLKQTGAAVISSVVSNAGADTHPTPQTEAVMSAEALLEAGDPAVSIQICCISIVGYHHRYYAVFSPQWEEHPRSRPAQHGSDMFCPICNSSL